MAVKEKTPEKKKEPEDKKWSDELDAKKFMVDVHMDFRRILGPDFKMAKLEENQKEFIHEMVPAALLLKDICPDKKIGEDIKEMIFAHVNTLAVLNFNKRGNRMMEGAIGEAKRPETPTDISLGRYKVTFTKMEGD